MERTVLKSASAGMEVTVTTSVDSAPVAPASWDDSVNKVCYTVLHSVYSLFVSLYIPPFLDGYVFHQCTLVHYYLLIFQLHVVLTFYVPKHKAYNSTVGSGIR